MATIADIAKASGVSTASVSYVLNNRHGAVSAGTRERVLQAMRDLNYRPSPLFMRKHARKSEVLGIAFTHPSLMMLTENPYFTLIIDGILSVTTAIGWDLIFFTTTSWTDFHKAMRAKCDGRCDGVALIGPDSNLGLIEVFKERGMPFICINAGKDLEGASTVDIDNEAAARAMTEYLLSLGHKRVALLPGHRNYPTSSARIQGYLAAMAASRPFDPELIIDGTYERNSGYERARGLLSRPASQRPTALFCGSDRIAFGAMDAAKELGVRIPQDLSIAGFDDIPQAASTDPPLTTMRQPLTEFGKTAAEVLLSHINDFTEMGQKTILPHELIVRSSTAAIGT
ncbi:MAG: LacI family DNA-binding transcriptional regulator [Capsulimonadaceae bacterium]|nr:LacI family DNA-binding transcriptional regulator [Capsulimonadaceae bacterium]